MMILICVNHARKHIQKPIHQFVLHLRSLRKEFTKSLSTLRESVLSQRNCAVWNLAIDSTRPQTALRVCNVELKWSQCIPRRSRLSFSARQFTKRSFIPHDLNAEMWPHEIITRKFQKQVTGSQSLLLTMFFVLPPLILTFEKLKNRHHCEQLCQFSFIVQDLFQTIWQKVFQTVWQEVYYPPVIYREDTVGHLGKTPCAINFDLRLTKLPIILIMRWFCKVLRLH